jgi:hypothetical protein
MFTRKDTGFEKDLPEISPAASNATRRIGNVVAGHRAAQDLEPDFWRVHSEEGSRFGTRWLLLLNGLLTLDVSTNSKRDSGCPVGSGETDLMDIRVGLVEKLRFEERLYRTASQPSVDSKGK